MRRIDIDGEGNEADANRLATLSAPLGRRLGFNFGATEKLSVLIFGRSHVSGARFFFCFECAQVASLPINDDSRDPAAVWETPYPFEAMCVGFGYAPIHCALERRCAPKIFRAIILLVAIDVIDDPRQLVQLDRMTDRKYEAMQEIGPTHQVNLNPPPIGPLMTSWFPCHPLIYC